MRQKLILFPFLILAACNGGGGDNGNNLNFIPDVELLCDSAQASDCNQLGLDVYAGLLDDTTVDCEDYLSQISAGNFAASFDASGEASSTLDNGDLLAFVTRWVNTQGNTISNLSESTYRLCAFVDTNGNRQLDTTEPVGEGEVTIGVTSASINDWFNANF